MNSQQDEPIHITLDLTHPEYAFIKGRLATVMIEMLSDQDDIGWEDSIAMTETLLRKLGDGDDNIVALHKFAKERLKIQRND